MNHTILTPIVAPNIPNAQVCELCTQQSTHPQLQNATVYFTATLDQSLAIVTVIQAVLRVLHDGITAIHCLLKHCVNV